MRSDFALALLIVILTAISRILFMEHDFGGFSYDSGSYALAARSYDLSQTRPHLPGYYLHVQAIKLAKNLTGSTHSAMVGLSIFYSSLGLGCLYFLLRQWLDKVTSLLLVGVTWSNPMVWFYGLVSEIYAFDLFFGVALALLGTSARTIHLTPFFVGFLSGVRPSSGVLLLPLYGFLWYRHLITGKSSVKRTVASHGAGIVGFLLWFVPMVESVGGVSQYLALYSTHNPVEDISVLQNGFRFSSFLVYLLPPWIVMALYALVKFLKNRSQKEPLRRTAIVLEKDFLKLMLWWLVPCVFFFGFVHYSKGYFLVCAAAFFCLLIVFLNEKPVSRIFLSTAILIQTMIFVFAPYSSPDLQTYISPGKRTLNLAQVWWDRTNSVYLMAQSHIRTKEKVARRIEAAFEAIDARSYDFVFLGPTFPLSIRSMQAKYPEMQFTRMVYHQKDQYEIYAGLSESSRFGLSEMMRRAVIVGREDFVRTFLNGIPKEVYYSGEFLVFRVRDEASDTLADRYQSFFLRA